MKKYLIVIKYRAIEKLKRIFRELRKNKHFLFFIEKNKLIRGYRIYEQLTGKSGKRLYLFPHNSLGDIYIIGLFYNMHNPLFDVPFQLVVVGNGCLKVANMMGIHDTIVIKSRQMKLLAQLAVMFQKELSDLKILHFEYPHTSFAPALVHENKYDFLKCYEKYVFNQEIRNNQFKLSLCTSNEKSKFNDLGLIQGKSVILSPHAKSVQLLPEAFWDVLAERLKAKGFKIFTNCNGKDEKPVTGTNYITFSLEEAVDVVNYAGYFVGIRSGFCDIISTSNCKKIIFYSRMDKRFLSSKDYYTISLLPGANNYYETFFSESPEYINYIISQISQDNKESKVED